MTWRERAADLGYASGWGLVRALPQRSAVRLFDAGARYSTRRGRAPEQLRRNLSRVIGAEPPHELLAASVRSYARYWREAFRLPSMDHAAIAAAVERNIYGLAHLDAGLARGNGVVLALPHSGNWDVAGVFVVQRYGRFATVAERLKPESLFWRFVRYRESLGFEIFPLSGGERPPYEQLAERLRAGGVVALLSERDMTKNGVPVTFFGEEARMPAGPARLAAETGATLLPVDCHFTADGWGIGAGEPIDPSGGIEKTTQVLADRFAANIAAHPEDWHMLQPLWLRDLSADRLARLR